MMCHGFARLFIQIAVAVSANSGLIATGTVDRDGRLTSADARLLALQLGAGGEPGGTLAIPQLATLARLARTLGLLVSRGVVAADGAKDLDLWVRAQPAGDEVKLAIAGWEERPKLIPDDALIAGRSRDFARLESDGEWACDPGLRLTGLSEELASLIGPNASAGMGQMVTRSFRLLENEAGDLPMLSGVSMRSAFQGQLAELRETPSARLWLHGEPVLLPSGDFGGYNGGYRLVERALAASAPSPISVAAVDDQFAKQLDAALRGPLARIISSADMIYERGDGPLRHDYAGYAGDISSAGRHLLGLVDDLVDLQAIERPDFRVETEKVDLVDLARRAAGLLSVRAADRSVRIDPPPTDEQLEAQGDFRRVLQILVNLVGNAVRYSPEGGSVWIRTEEEGDLAAIIIADQGKGIAEPDQARIFEKFERVDQNEPGGSGLGLYISRKLARAMGGDISVDSAPGQGARFVLTLPIR
jgi:signal transduction histidine kinase